MIADYSPVSSVTCPSCESGEVRQVGPISPSNIFAGRVLGQVLPGGFLWRCSDCCLEFRYPRLPRSEIDKLYQLGNNESWATPVEGRTDWILVSKMISSLSGISRILDAGCFDGRLLEYLGQGYERWGVEIHKEAAEKARQRGVHVVSADYSKLPLCQIEVDAAIAVDVIEHSYDPLEFLACLASVVREDGIIIITTGNTDAPTWRLMGSSYWYCHIAEHLSFINPKWARNAAQRLGLEVVAIERFSHMDDSTFSHRLYETFANLVYRASPRLFSGLRRLGGGSIDLKRYPELLHVPPYWLSARDHMLVEFKKRITL
ncbi:MAG: class I SAM-dependent methyltransferase [Gammaproteobacteria bacterium]|nr:class I SAM-dependent methyltransferase [Gammaproteobacteria bacterium]